MTETDEKRLNVRVEASLMRRVKAQAALQDKPLSEVVRELLAGWLESQLESQDQANKGASASR